MNTLYIVGLAFVFLASIFAFLVTRAKEGYEDHLGYHEGCGCNKCGDKNPSFVITSVQAEGSSSKKSYVYSCGDLFFKVIAVSFTDAEQTVADAEYMKEKVPGYLWKDVQSNPILFEEKA